MKKRLIALIFATFGFGAGSAQAEPLYFLDFLCETPTDVFVEEFSGLRQKYQNAYRRYTLQSRYRQHVERHINEIRRRLHAVEPNQQCDADKREQLVYWTKVMDLPPWKKANLERKL